MSCEVIRELLIVFELSNFTILLYPTLLSQHNPKLDLNPCQLYREAYWTAQFVSFSPVVWQDKTSNLFVQSSLYMFLKISFDVWILLSHEWFILQYLSWTNFYPRHPCISSKFDLLKASGEPEKLLNHHRSNKSVDMFCRMSYEAEIPHWRSFTCPPQWCHRLLCEGLMLATAINQ